MVMNKQNDGCSHFFGPLGTNAITYTQTAYTK